MRFGVICDLIAHAQLEREAATVFKLGVEVSFEAEQDVALHAPVVGAHGFGPSPE